MAGLNISKEELSEIIATAIAAAKEPSAAERREAEKAEREFVQAQADRKANAEGQIQLIQDKRQERLACSHEHPNGDSHCVYVQESKGPGYIICQRNQCKIRPEPRPEKYYDHDALYSTAEFNRLFQRVATGDGIFG